MATIEPRLIHLLNDSTNTPRPSNSELPPIKDPFPQASTRPLPIEPGAGQRLDALDAWGEPIAQQHIPSLYPLADDNLQGPSIRKEIPGYAPTDRPHATHVSSQDLSLRMILDETPADSPEDVSTKKRPVKEDFPQLPQPPKKQKATAHMCPPIIVGLLEPPSNAALFPPISSASFEHHASADPPQALGLIKPPEIQGFSEETAAPSPTPDPERTPTGKVKRRATKPRRKWSEEETRNLLLGVSKHGVGKWTDILDDPEYRFNDRTAGDLKDRFRTCCPEELRGSAGAKGGGPQQKPGARAEMNRRNRLAKILNDKDQEVYGNRNSGQDEGQNEGPNEGQNEGQNDSEPTTKQRKSRAHRKNLEDLAELGIKGPFKKSQRRERRPFSEQDDLEILRGFEMYGPHWTKIQRDPRFNLESRQPTDLRDRLRNRYPEKFSTEKTTMQIRNNVLEPSVNMDIKNSLHLSKTSRPEPQPMRTSSREDIPKLGSMNGYVETGEQPATHQGLYWGEAGNGSLPSGEMDISRLLLYDTQHVNEPLPNDRRGYG